MVPINDSEIAILGGFGRNYPTDGVLINTETMEEIAKVPCNGPNRYVGYNNYIVSKSGDFIFLGHYSQDRLSLI